jgi:CheY-like chemotaxis protein
MNRECTRILLVEDDDGDRKAIERLVKKERLPYELVVASTVAEAVGQLQQGGFDLALNDCKLPDGSGLEVQAQAGDTPCIVGWTSPSVGARRRVRE